MGDQAPGITEASRPAALDIAHLDRQTLNNVALRREVLALFDEHAARMLSEIEGGDPAGRRAAAHSLVGSARGIGAFAVANAAAAVEAGGEGLSGAIAALAAAVGDARRAIGEHLSD